MRKAADLLDLADDASFEGVADALREVVAGAEHPLAAAAGASAAAMKLFRDAPAPTGADVSSAGNKPHAEIFALWLADLALARRLGWDAPVPLLATAITHSSWRRGAGGKRPRPGDPDWAKAVAGAYAMAAREAIALAGELSRRSQALFGGPAQIAGQGRGARRRTFCLDDDAVAPATRGESRGCPIAPAVVCSIG